MIAASCACIWRAALPVSSSAPLSCCTACGQDRLLCRALEEPGPPSAAAEGSWPAPGSLNAVLVRCTGLPSAWAALSARQGRKGHRAQHLLARGVHVVHLQTAWPVSRRVGWPLSNSRQQGHGHARLPALHSSHAPAQPRASSGWQAERAGSPACAQGQTCQAPTAVAGQLQGCCTGSHACMAVSSMLSPASAGLQPLGAARRATLCQGKQARGCSCADGPCVDS